MPEEMLGEGQEHSTAEDVEFLSQDDKNEEEKVSTETKEEVEEKVEDLKEKKEEEKKEEKEEGKEESEEVYKELLRTRPSPSQITAKYPNFFKDFPDIKDMYFRENEYTKVGTVEEVKEMAEENERFTAADEMICEGTIEGTSKFLGFMKESDKEIYAKHVENFLPALAKSDPDKHYEILLPIAENLFRTLYDEGIRTGNKNFANAALHASNYYFGSPEFASGQRTSTRQRNEVDTERASFDREREEFYAQQYDKAVEQVEVIITGTLNKEIAKGLGEGLNEYLTKTLTKEIIGEVDRAIVNDRDFVGKRDSLWKNARKYGYSKESLDRIISAYLSRARQIMPAIRTKVRSAAMESRMEQVEKEKSKEGRRELSGGGQQRFGGKSYSPKHVDYSKTSDMDILNDNVTMRR